MQIAKIGSGMQPATLDEAMNLAQRIAHSEIVPKNYRDKPDDILVSIMLGAECGLSAIQSLQNIAVINGRPSIYGDAMLALVQNHASFESIVEKFDNENMVATCTVKRKGAEPHTTTFSKADAEQAKLWTKGGVWTAYPKRMLQMRARGFALRDQFSDALLGLISREEAEDIRDITAESYVVSDKTETSAPVQGELVDLPTMEDGRFAHNMTQYESMINSGKKTHDEVIYTLRGKYHLTDTQVKAIKAIKL